jgi:hypothetical protein
MPLIDAGGPGPFGPDGTAAADAEHVLSRPPMGY